MKLLLLLITLYGATAQAKESVMFFGEVNQSNTRVFLAEWSRIKSKDVDLKIISPGGSINSMEVLIYNINSSDKNINIICLYCASAAFFMLQRIKGKRLITVNSEPLMTHKIYYYGLSYISLDNIDSIKSDLMEVNELAWNSIKNRVKISKSEYFSKIKGKDWDITPEEALKYGFIDEIIK